ncbi:glycosyltransferase [Actinomyces bowdenii]|uniref:Glycosyltransferase n=1 Tax=Actinomyces bowdenii TaxID=131109 RepID=A0A853EJG2_9ACTO|nr:glycosyltransferase [Actinomyces bowdenii]NYS69409.1 glycosyltransferase [Actinomyces bowdenii]
MSTTAPRPLPPRVVVVIDDLHRPNGIVSCVDLLAGQMLQEGIVVDILCFGPCDPDLAQRHRVITALPGRRYTSAMAGFERSKAVLKPLRHALTALWWPVASARLRRLARHWGPEALVIGAGLDAVRLLDRAGVRPRILVSQVHADVEALTPAQWALVRGASTVSRIITALTPEGARRLQDRGIPAVFLPNPAPEAGGRADVGGSRTVVYLGRLSSGKQIDHLIDAFEQAAPEDWRLRIYGGGPQEGALREHAARARGDIELCGTVDDVGPVLQGAAIHALPSRSEGLSMSILEANMAGVPTLAYDSTPGMRLAMGAGAPLVPQGDRQALAQALSRLMSDDEARAQAGRRAYEHGRSFSAHAVVARWIELWQELRAQERGHEDRGEPADLPR